MTCKHELTEEYRPTAIENLGREIRMGNWYYGVTKDFPRNDEWLTERGMVNGSHWIRVTYKGTVYFAEFA